MSHLLSLAACSLLATSLLGCATAQPDDAATSNEALIALPKIRVHAATANALYYANAEVYELNMPRRLHSGRAYRAAADGSNPVDLGYDDVGSLAVSGNYLAYTTAYVWPDEPWRGDDDYRNVAVGTVTGGPATVVAEKQIRPENVRIVGLHVYWSAQTNSNFYRPQYELRRALLTSDGASPPERVTPFATEGGPVGVGNDLFVVRTSDVAVVKINLLDTTFPATTVAPARTVLRLPGLSIAELDASVYVRDDAGISKVVSPNGGAPELLVPKDECQFPLGANTIAASDDSIFAVCSIKSPNGSVSSAEVRKYDLAGARIATLGQMASTWSTNFSDLSVTSSHVYVRADDIVLRSNFYRFER